MVKMGIDYFPFMCQDSEAMELLQADFGLKASAVIVKLYQKIFGQLGYYCVWNSEVQLLFSRKDCSLSPGDNCVSEIVKTALKRGIFDMEMYEKHSILTSKWIQEKFFEAVKRRVCVEVEKSYLLIKVDQIPKNVNINEENVNINQKNVCRNQQSKEEKSKVKESKESIGADAPPHAHTKNFIKPTVEEVQVYCNERKNGIDAQRFIDYYLSVGWMVGKNHMKDWKAAIRTWERREASSRGEIYNGKNRPDMQSFERHKEPILGDIL